MSKNVLIIGGGITGIQAALDVANTGYKAILVEKSQSIGGHMLQLSEVFPTLDCPQCIGTPKMTEVSTHPNIRLMTYSEVENICGEAGRFKVTIRQKARYVNESKCIGCGVCQEKCPWNAENEFDLGLSKRKVIYTLFPQAVPAIPVIDREHCAYFQKKTCRVCERFCESKAIDFEQVDNLIEIEVGAIIVATGFEIFDPLNKPELGYGTYPNVITGMELERLAQAGGPTGGKIEINGKEPKNVVFIQCVGSRDKSAGAEYCSRVCCMASTKQAWYVKHKIPDAKVTVYYIDLRAFGKRYEEFYDKIQQYGVSFNRGIVSEVYKNGDKLVVRAEDTSLGEIYEEEADLVVLAAGLRPNSSTVELARKLNIPLGADGFFLGRHPQLGTMESGVDGIYLAGCCEGPKDITDSIVQAGAAAYMSCLTISTTNRDTEKERVIS